MLNSTKRAAATAIALTLGVALGACTGNNHNASLYSVKQPVVERANYTLDLGTSAGGLAVSEQARLADWFETIGLGYGDRIGLDDPSGDPAVYEDVAAVASRYGLLISAGTPVTEGYVNPGNARVVVTRSTAHVPGCPDWGGSMSTSLTNETSDGYGCAVNSNLAAMVANPEHLLEGEKGTGETVIMSHTKAIETYRNQTPTGAGGLKAESAGGGGN